MHELTLDAGRQPPGGYVVKWRALTNDSAGETGLSIMPPFDAAALRATLDRSKTALAPGSVTSLELMIEEVGADLARLHAYETAAAARIKLERVNACLDAAARRVDCIAAQRGFVRMAYRSSVDGTLQPYVVYVPPDFDPARKYPLLVYLHGSAGDERDVTAIKAIPAGFIVLGPRGRGPSNWYSWDHAQSDIAEAVASVKQSFPIDERNVFLSGFSMGGYGVYRTYYEAPKTYRGIAIFSGAPRILFGAPDGVNALDLGDSTHIKSFNGVPVFIFHGKRDMNVPYAGTEELVARLERAGARVEFHSEEGKGHEAAGDDTIAAFFRWIDAHRAR
jgi:poly(3-hydroxybutyrate) depolymerase